MARENRAKLAVVLCPHAFRVLGKLPGSSGFHTLLVTSQLGCQNRVTKAITVARQNKEEELIGEEEEEKYWQTSGIFSCKNPFLLKDTSLRKRH